MRFRSPTIIIIKKNKIYLLLTFVLIVIGVKIVAASIYTPPTHWTIVIDPGHGGVDGGTALLDEQLLEKDIVLQVGHKIEQVLEGTRINVVMTRVKDMDLSGMDGIGRGRHSKDLKERIEIVKQNQADVMISLHLNWTSDPKANGVVLLYQKNNKKSKQLVDHLEQSFEKFGIDLWEPPIPRDLYVLRNSPCPAVLIELGFISNAEERSLLRNEQYQERLAHAICSGIIEYINIESPWPVF